MRLAEVQETDVELDLGLPASNLQRARRRRTPRAKTARSRRLWIQPVLSEAMLSVGAFHTAFNLPRRLLPQDQVPAELVQLRVALLEEELGEFRVAAESGDLVGVADALGDILYVVYGAALTYGIDLDAVLREVHRSNMSKLDASGKPLLRADGKVLKSERFSPPDLTRVLKDQPPLPFAPFLETQSS
jgi:predicted HAD superfamily Cof-like phosphohydrolase